MVYECEKCGTALRARALNCLECGESFDQPVPLDAEVPMRGWQPKSQVVTSSAENPLSVKLVPDSLEVASIRDHQTLPQGSALPTSDFVSGQSQIHVAGGPVAPTAVPAPSSKKYNIWKIIWRMFLALLCVGALGEAAHGELSGFWLVALFGLPTLWLSKNLMPRLKVAISGVFGTLFLCFAIFSITPQGKAAHAAFEGQEAHDAQIAAAQQKQKENNAAKQQAKETKDEAHTKALEAKAQAKQAKEQAKHDNEQAAEYEKQAQENKVAAAEAQQNTDDSDVQSADGIDLTYDQVTQSLDEYITMQKSSDVHGQTRYLGQTDDKLAMLEVIGDSDNISEATLIIGLPDDSDDVLARNTAFFIRFVMNVSPGWDGASQWTAQAVKQAAAAPGESI